MRTNMEGDQDNFHMASTFNQTYQRTAQSVYEVTLDLVVRAFIRNMNRVRGMGLLPIKLVAGATIDETARLEALIRHNIPFDDPRIEPGNASFDEALYQQIDKERDKIISQWVQIPDVRERVRRRGVDGLNRLLAAGRKTTWEGVQATMAGMLMGLWTAFESLAQDTWLAAVDARPIPLAQRVLEPDARLETGEQSKSISWKVISRAGFDFRASMGQILLRERKVDFLQLKTIRAAYNVAFASEFEPIFEAHSENLSRLEAVRNLFAHKGGLIDEKFRSRMRNDPEYKDSIAGNLLEIKGDSVVRSANTVSDCGTSLVEGVDKWLSSNPYDKEVP